MILEHPEQLEVLFAKYPVIGSFVLGSDSFTEIRYDAQKKNELVVTVQAGEKMQYEERPRIDHGTQESL
jgi:hypothetical protein